MKIAIAGKLCSGKSFLAKYLQSKLDCNIYSFGYGVKKYCKEIFNMEYKDRKLLQDFAQKMREIDNDVWIKYTIRYINNDKNEHILLDDLRFPNEANYLKEAGFTIIRLIIDDTLQKERIQKTYPESYKEHLLRKNDISESFIDKLPFDYNILINENNEKMITNIIDNILIEIENNNKHINTIQ